MAVSSFHEWTVSLRDSVFKFLLAMIYLGLNNRQKCTHQRDSVTRNVRQIGSQAHRLGPKKVPPKNPDFFQNVRQSTKCPLEKRGSIFWQGLPAARLHSAFPAFLMCKFSSFRDSEPESPHTQKHFCEAPRRFTNVVHWQYVFPPGSTLTPLKYPACVPFLCILLLVNYLKKFYCCNQDQ